MKPIDKKDQPKLIAIIVICVPVFGWLLWSMLAPSTAPTPAATAAQTATQPAPGTVVKNVTAQVGTSPGQIPLPPVDESMVAFSEATTGKDPFVPNGSAAEMNVLPIPVRTTVVSSAPAVRPTSQVLPEYMRRLALPSTLPRANKRLFDEAVGGQPAGQPAAVVVKLPPPPPPAYTITGVVMGDATQGDDRNIAILRGQKGATGTTTGADERRFVKVGDDVGNGFKVTKIEGKGVELRGSDGRTARIEMGKIGGQNRAAN